METRFLLLTITTFYMKLFFTALIALFLLTETRAQVLYYQDFEDGFQEITLIDNDGNVPHPQLSSFTAAWNVRGDLLGNAAVSLSWYEPAGQSDDWMILPVISGITGNTVLEWDARSFEASTLDSYKILISVGGDNMADFTDELFHVDGEVANGAFTHHFVPLGEYAGQNIRIAFVNNSNDRYLLAVDNILVRRVYTVDVALTKVEIDPYVRTGIPNPVHYTVKNNGFQTIDSLVIDWSDGLHNFSEHLTGLGLGFGASYDGVFSNPFTATDSDEHLMSFNIASVGGHPDELPGNNSLTAISAGVWAVVPRRVVGEEATGTWCGWCPRGAVFMEYMHENYPDVFIPIAVHNGPVNPMTNVEYHHAFDTFFNYPPSPSVTLDRKTLVDPLDLDSAVQVLRQVVAPIAVTVQTSLDSVTRSMHIEGQVTTYTHRTNAKFNLVLVVVENDVRGTANGYRQTNYYSGGAEGVMGGYENLPNPVPASQMRYDFVARQLLYGFHGLAGVIPGTFHENDVYAFTAAYDIPITYDMDQLYVVAMVVDSASGVVLNAAKSETATSAVKSGIRELQSVHIYPNPTHNGAWVDIELAEAATVGMTLLNQMGQSVYVHDDGKLPAGHSILPLSSDRLSAGVYVMKIDIAGKTVLRKLVIE